MDNSIIDVQPEKRFRWFMNNFKFQILRVASVCAMSFFLFSACKPKEQPVASPVSSAPEATNPPAAGESATNVSEAQVPGTISPEDAKNYVGKTVTVRGKVDRVYVSQKGDIFIDMGGKHPNAAFTAVCFQQAIPAAQLQTFNGQTISVKGTIKNYQGKVEIVLTSADQISQ
jgi:hypothetical protein